MLKYSKTNRSSSSPAVERAIMRKSVAGILFTRDDDDLSDDEDLGYAALASKTVSDFAGSLAYKINHIIKSSRNSKLSPYELTSHVIKDPALWKEFLKELDDSNVVTNVGVKEVLHKFIAEKEKDITAASRAPSKVEAQITENSAVIGRAVTSPALSGMAAAASSMKKGIQKKTSMDFVLKRPSSGQHRDCSDATQRSERPRKVTFSLGDSSPKTAESTSTLSGMVAAASSVSRSIQKRATMSFALNRPSSDQHQNCSNRVSEMPRRVTFDLGDSSAKNTSEKMSGMSVDNFQRKISCRSHTSSPSETRHYAQIPPNTLTENSLQCNEEWSQNTKLSSSHKYHGNAAKMKLIERMATSNFPIASLSCDVVEGSGSGSELIETWGNKTTRSSLIKTNKEEIAQVREKVASAIEVSPLEQVNVFSNKLDMPASNKLIKKNTKRAFHDTQFHIEKECDTHKSKEHTSKFTNEMKIAHSTPCMRDTKGTDAFTAKMKQNGSSFTSFFVLNCPNTPVELVTLYLD